MSLKYKIVALLVCLSAFDSMAQEQSTSMLDRQGLAPTFADEFDTFSWFEEDATGKKGGGHWHSNFAHGWCKPDEIQCHTLANNKEEQLYVDREFRGTGSQALGIDPFAIRDGKLIITANRAPDVPALSGFKYTSGMITSKREFVQQYGVFEMRAKLPRGKGLWPAFWLIPKDGTWPPELDIMEMLGHEPDKFYTTLHSKAGGKYSRSDIPAHKVADMSADFHTYAVDWGPQEIVFYFDEHEVARRPTPGDMHKPFFIIANLAVGGKWPGSPTAETVFPATLAIDWIRVWQRPGYTP